MPSFVLPVIVTLDISAFDPERCIPLLTFVSVVLTIGPITYTTSFISFISWFSLGLILNSFNKKFNVWDFIVFNNKKI